MELTRRAITYSRVSTESQDGIHGGTSLETQAQACVSYCQEHGYTVLQSISETWTGAEWRERPALSRLREMVRARMIDVLVCYKVDRLARNQNHLAIILDELLQHGVRLEFVQEQLSDDPIGRMVFQFQGMFAEYEREQIGERTQRGTIEKAKRGMPRTGRLPFGYVWRDDDHNYYVPSPDAPIVQRLFDEAMGGASLNGLIRMLYDQGIPSPTGGRTWSAPGVRYILTNPVYMGQFVFGRRSIKKRGGKLHVKRVPEADWITSERQVSDPLISEETFLAVQQGIEERGRLPRQRQLVAEGEEVLLNGGLALCGHCRRALILYRRGNGKRYYRCLGRSNLPEPLHVWMECSTLDTLVWNALRSAQSKPPEPTHSDSYTHDIAALDGSLKKVDRQMASLSAAVADVEDDDVRASLLKQLHEASGRRRDILAQATVLKQHAAQMARSKRSYEDFQAKWNEIDTQTDPTMAERREVLEWLQATAILSKNADGSYHATLEYLQPVAPECMSKENTASSSFLEHAALHVRLAFAA